MKIMVCIKRVVDYNVRIQIKPDNSGVITEGVKMSINPFDEIAMEEALRLKEAGHASEIVVVTIGDEACQEQLRTALAMGADRALRLATGKTPMDKLTITRLLLSLVEREQPDIVLMGKQAIDEDDNQSGQMLATLWGRPQATFASKVDIKDESVHVTREVDTGLEVLEIDLPAVITTDLRLNQPRYVKLPALIKAKRKPIETIEMETLGVTVTQTVKLVEVTAPTPRQGGHKVANVQALVDELKTRGVM